MQNNNKYQKTLTSPQGWWNGKWAQNGHMGMGNGFRLSIGMDRPLHPLPQCQECTQISTGMGVPPTAPHCPNVRNAPKGCPMDPRYFDSSINP